ncbi:apolipoprotein N-acyltransferase [Campylobacter geochelonis]|uniref:apolipoprotein N-acyltransferase n=1 Tax=Campylobacter geochelonis TaxID=1780362 RepID=UPI00094C493D|nr:apolipoprotein N-acyltransferase [Campylobacter geochelonis]QKF70978.1 apolipoprotein N-acyltransferase [Campylobacter geochelonis]
MSLKYFLAACRSFIKNLISRYFTINEIIKGFFIALLISNFIFLTLFDNLILEFISPFLAIYGFYKLFDANRFEFFHTGFFIGILWFYWVSFSLVYYGFAFLIPLEILFFGLVYGLIFLVCGWWKNKFIRAILLILISYFYPFNFNWLNLELVLVPGLFEPNLRGLCAIFAGILAFYYLKKFKLLGLFVGVILALQITQEKPNFLPLKTKLINTQISQYTKWNPKFSKQHIIEALNLIDEAIKDGYKFIVLPENAFVTHLNLEPNLEQILKEKSHFSTILTGALAYENGRQYNSSFLFSKGSVQRFDKFILVPFGEEIPLPNFIKKALNLLFFNGAKDFDKASSFSDYKVDNQVIRNAICYEVTRSETYKNSPKFVVAISNNGWFTPSTEPNLQRLLIKYYATKHGTTVYHSVNGSKSEIITPKELWVVKFINLFKK